MSPKKVRLVTDMIKGLPVVEAFTRLQFTGKSVSPILSKLLKSAVANARHNSEISEDVLFVKQVFVNTAKPLKRWKPAAFGSVHTYKKHGTHIDLILGTKAGAKIAARPKEKAKDTKEGVRAVSAAEARKLSARTDIGGRQMKQQDSAPRSADEHREVKQVRKTGEK